MKNLEIAKILYNIADLLEIKEVKFKPQAYRNAAKGVEGLAEDIAKVHQRGELENIPGVGEHIAAKISEIIKTGKLKYYNKLKKEVRVDVEGLKLIPTLGPKKILILYKKLNIKTIADLQKAIKKGKLEKLKGFSKITTTNLLAGIQLVKSRPQRFLYAHLELIVEEISSILKRAAGVSHVEVAGSFRRRKETIGDLDFIVVTRKPKAVIDTFTNLPDVKKVLASGTRKSSILLTNGLQVDLRLVKQDSLGAARQYFIGNKQHNIALRQMALRRSYTLNEYGLFKNKHKIAGKSEEQIYQKLGLSWIPPEIRRNDGEIRAAEKGEIPSLIEKKNIKGVFHLHSNWSDGNDSMLRMAKQAEQLGLKFISFNDHFGPIGITNPLIEKRLSGYLKAIDKVRKKVGLRIFSGLEIDILKNGELPLGKKRLSSLDVIIAAVHLATKMPQEKMTQRICKALENQVHILGHPTDRLLQKRQGLNLNLDKIFTTCKERGTFLEINGVPQRMDLSGELIKKALNIGCKLAIGNDAHTIQNVKDYKYGVFMARRGWAEKKDVLNCWPIKKIEKIFS